MATSSLTDARLRSLKPTGRPYKITDRDGLYVSVSATGTRSFRYNFSIGDKQQTLTYGRYPVMTLEEARRNHHKAKVAIQSGQNPAQLKREHKAQAQSNNANTFAAVAQRWYEMKRVPIKAQQTLAKDQIFLKDTAAAFGSVPIQDVTNEMVLRLLRSKLNEGQRNWPGRLRQKMSSVFRFAQGEGIDCRNVADAVREAVELNLPHVNHPFIKDHQRMGQLLRDSENYAGDIRVRVASCRTCSFALVSFGSPLGRNSTFTRDCGQFLGTE